VEALYSRRRRFYGAYVQAFAHRQGLTALLARSTLLGDQQCILDAGCGTGLSIIALVDALKRRGLHHRKINAFDLTPKMLDACRKRLDRQHVPSVELRQADTTRLDRQLPTGWTDYDLIICVSMLEHIPRTRLTGTLAALRQRLAPNGRLLVVVTRKSFYPTRRIWRCNGYNRRELRQASTSAGFRQPAFRRYPWTHWWLNVGNHVLELSSNQATHQHPPLPRREFLVRRHDHRSPADVASIIGWLAD
jgi:2-polyprenyl-3-methyl-5-hydroxy-6-metoxy-1,4-benzoquinol methylase